MATFPDYDPLYGAVKTVEPEFRTVRFGDGYEHRFILGLHNNVRKFDLTFDLADEDADVIENFLFARVTDQESFTWQPPGPSAVAGEWVCESRTREIYAPGRSRLQLTFREVFEP